MQPVPTEQLETNLRAAIDAGDEPTIRRISDDLDRRERPQQPVPLVSAALWYASVGLRVFPLQPRSKVPWQRSHGCKDATTDLDRIRAWWAAVPDSNIGIATGHLVDVVDVDGPEGQRSRAAMWEDTFAKVDADNVGKVLTPRPGGMHIYVPATGEGNLAGIAPGVDYRGAGGYVVAPPSLTDVGSYRWLVPPALTGLQALTTASGAA